MPRARAGLGLITRGPPGARGFDVAHGALGQDVAGVQRGGGLEEQHLDLVFGDRSVFNAARDDEHVARAEFDLFIAELHDERAAVDEEEFVLVLVEVPVERSFELHEFDLLSVEVRGHAR